ncbi:hypothetical protein RN001_006321 [Aquatica leii]|uniref:Uncharacterized protein n=1 Tax=Aquatica leii TaxID=1421715 RepID=A0AAN7PDC4_9COLE|nr:hypothetical protein RN001_006321 [Aquatica leii]
MAPTKTRKKGNKIAPWAPQWWSRGREHLPKIFITRGPKKPRPDEPTPPATVDSQINQLNQQMSRLLEETTTTTVASQVDRLSERMKQLFGETPPSSPTTYRGEEEAPLADELELPSPMQALPVDLEMPSPLTLQAARTTIPKLDPTAPFFVSIPLERIFRSEVTAPERPIPTPPPCHIPECTAVRKETSRPQGRLGRSLRAYQRRGQRRVFIHTGPGTFVRVKRDIVMAMGIIPLGDTTTTEVSWPLPPDQPW